jgi:hypothetical protein
MSRKKILVARSRRSNGTVRPVLNAKRSIFRPIRKTKYGNKPTEWVGLFHGKKQAIKFDSIAEMRRGVDLIRLESAGIISDLQFQKSFELVPKSKDERRVTYRSDFYYFDNELKSWVSEDKKSVITKKNPAYIIKRKLMKWLYSNIYFKES